MQEAAPGAIGSQFILRRHGDAGAANRVDQHAGSPCDPKRLGRCQRGASVLPETLNP